MEVETTNELNQLSREEAINRLKDKYRIIKANINLQNLRSMEVIKALEVGIHTSPAELKTIRTELVDLIKVHVSVIQTNDKTLDMNMIELTNIVNAADLAADEEIIELIDHIKALTSTIQVNNKWLVTKLIELANKINATANCTNCTINVDDLTLQLSQCGVSSFGTHQSKQDD